VSIAAVDVANTALALLGIPGISSLSDDNAKARAMSRSYDIQRRAELRAHLWSFAMARTTTPASSTVPAFDFAAQYAFPTDALRIVQAGDWYPGEISVDYSNATNADYRLEGRFILSNVVGAPLKVRYVSDVTDPNLLDPLFVVAFAARLASATCLLLTESNVKKKDISDDYKMAITQAVQVNAVEKTPEQLPDNSWMIARL
jgi:hypothetical protein